MKRTLVVVFCVSIMMPVCLAQDTMRIHYKGGGCSDVAIEQVDSITFVKESDAPSAEVNLIGAWLWGNQQQG